MTQHHPEVVPYGPAATQERTAGLADSEVKHLSCFDDELISGTAGLGATLELANGRQIGVAPDGTLLLVMTANPGVLLAIGKPHPDGPPRLPQWSEAQVVAGTTGAAPLGRVTGSVGGASVAVGADGRVALVWHDQRGAWLARGTFSAGAIRWQGSGNLLVPGRHVSDVAFDGGGKLVVLHEGAAGEGAEGLTLTTCDPEVRHETVAVHGSEGVMCVDPETGALHVVYQHVTRRAYRVGEYKGEMIEEFLRYRGRRGGTWGAEEQVSWPIALHPAVTLWNGEPLVVFQSEGVHPVVPMTKEYLHQREGGGSGVGYAVRRAGKWEAGAIARQEELIVADRRERDVFDGRVYAMVEHMHRPRLTTDRHGVAWAVWPNTVRRHTYAARWLGEAFSAPMEVRGGWAGLSAFIAIPSSPLPQETKFYTDPQPAPGAPGRNPQSLLPIVTLAADRAYATPIVIPSLNAANASVLFLDLLEIAGMEGIEHEIGRLQRYSGNPLFEPSRTLAWDDGSVACPALWYDGGRYIMQYQGRGTLLPGVNTVTGIAESPDGIHWTRPPLHVYDVPGQPDNNCIPWIYFFRDQEEPDPAKRYKGARTHSHWTKDLRRTLAYSPDAIHWAEDGEMVNLHCVHEANGPSFRDTLDVPERRFKAVGRTCCDEGRTAGIMWSADCRHWEGYEATLDNDDPYGQPALSWRGRYNANRFLHPAGEDRAGHQGTQIYWNTIWIEHGIYLCLYGPMHWDGGFDAALAVSRDCRQWVRVCGGRPLLEREPVGRRESGSLFMNYGNARPMRFGDRLRVYYSSGVRHHGTEPHATFTGSGIGFADIGIDRWASLRLKRDSDSGSFTTIPIDVAAGAFALRVNASGAGDGALRVGVLDADARAAVPGLGAEACAVSAADGTELEVTWRGGKIVGPRRVRLRFELRGARTKVYGFKFGRADAGCC